MGIEDILDGNTCSPPIIGPINKDGFRLGYNSVIEGYVKVGKNVTIGNGTYIISRKSKVTLEDNVSIGDMNIIKEGDGISRNNEASIYIGEGVRTEVNVRIKNNCYIGKRVHLGSDIILGRNIYVGDDCRLNEKVILAKNVILGKRNVLYNCSIGYAPQGKGYEDEDTKVIIGNDNVIREYTVIHRGYKERGNAKTVIGSNNEIQSQCHIAHDCSIGNNNVITTMSGLAGHVFVGNNVRISGQVGVAQFVHIGDGSFIAGQSAVSGHVVPYSVVRGNPAVLKTINTFRLKQFAQNYDDELKELRQCYKLIKGKGGMVKEDILKSLEGVDSKSAECMRNFISSLLNREETAKINILLSKDYSPK